MPPQALRMAWFGRGAFYPRAARQRNSDAMPGIVASYSVAIRCNAIRLLARVRAETGRFGAAAKGACDLSANSAATKARAVARTLLAYSRAGPALEKSDAYETMVNSCDVLMLHCIIGRVET